jgi:hypothetical protein
MRFLDVPRNGVLTAIAALTIADLLHALRPNFIHPQNNVDVITKVFVSVLLFGPFIFGFVLPLGPIFMRLCDSNLRKSYSAVAFGKDISWYALIGFAMILSYRCGWLFQLNR